LKEVVSVSDIVNITGGLSVDTITLPTIGDVETSIQGKQPTINETISVSCDTLITAGNATIGGTLNVSGSLINPNQPCFKVIRTNTSISCVAGENLKLNEAVIDNRNGYISTDFEYTIPVAGKWYLYYSFACDGIELKVQFQQNSIIRDEITSVTIPFPNKISLGCKGMVIIPCSVSDIIRVRVDNGSVALNYINEIHSFGGFWIG